VGAGPATGVATRATSVWLPSAPGYAAPNIVTSWVPAADGITRTQGFEVIRWMERCLVHTEGEWAGRPFRLLPWQKRLILELFTLVPDEEWVPVPGQPLLFRRGLRRKYRQAFITVPKKNGKTELAAALACYLLVGDREPSPKGVVVAGALKQAALSFRGVQTMLLRSPVLRLMVSERDVGDLTIEIPSIAGSRLERVASEAGTNDGPSLHFAVLDEVHEYEGEGGINVHGVITNAGAARRNPLSISISTVGVDPEDDVEVQDRSTIWSRLWGRGWAAIEHPEADPSFYFLCAQSPPGSDWQDRTSWEQGNPSAGVTVSWSFYREQWAKGEGWCDRYYRNLPPGHVEEPWMPPEVWAACSGDPVFTRTDPVYVATRISHDHRSAAIASAQRHGEQVHVRARIFPEKPLAEGEYLDADELEDYVRRLHERYPARVLAAVARRPGVRGQVRVRPAEGPEVSYHGAFFESSAQRLERDGIVMLDIPHTQERMAPAAELLLQLATAGALVHDGSHAFSRHVGAVSAKQDTRGWRLQLPTGGGRRAEAAVAAMFAVSRAVLAPRAPSRTLRRPRAGGR
jgi:phage terminase large subunit-like protein